MALETEIKGPGIPPSLASIILFDDFLGKPGAFPVEGDVPTGALWAQDADAGAEVGIANIVKSSGWAKLALPADDAPKGAILKYMGSSNPYHVDSGLIIEWRFAFHDAGAGLQIEMGMDNSSFRINILKDGSDNRLSIGTGPQDTGINLAEDTAYKFKIDGTDDANLKYYLNDKRLLPGTMLSATGAFLRPRMMCLKNGGTETTILYLDYVRLRQAVRPDFFT